MPELIIEFIGGPLDGKSISSDKDPELCPTALKFLLASAAQMIDRAAREERKHGTLLTWRVPSPSVSEQAKAEGWSEAKIAALMPYYEYTVNEYAEAEAIIIFTARCQGKE